MGKRWQGKGCIEEGLIIFEGEYHNGELNGKGLEYNKEGQLIFEGEYKDGKKNGKGKKYDGNELIFEGEYLKGKKWNIEANSCYDDCIIQIEIKNGNGKIKKFRKYGEKTE